MNTSFVRHLPVLHTYGGDGLELCLLERRPQLGGLGNHRLAGTPAASVRLLTQLGAQLLVGLRQDESTATYESESHTIFAGLNLSDVSGRAGVAVEVLAVAPVLGPGFLKRAKSTSTAIRREASSG
jgi:hypothetical protein